jgi:ADP-ribose pyrophosphatase YjhB (NUDIX family)
MDNYKDDKDFGSVMTCIISPKRHILLVRKLYSPEGVFWKFPGGKIKRTDKGIVPAAARETTEETGMKGLLPEEVKLYWKQWELSGIYYPHLCIARVSEEKLNTRERFTFDDNSPLETGIFEQSEIPMMMPLLLKRHHLFFQDIERL